MKFNNQIFVIVIIIMLVFNFVLMMFQLTTIGHRLDGLKGELDDVSARLDSITQQLEAYRDISQSTPVQPLATNAETGEPISSTPGETGPARHPWHPN